MGSETVYFEFDGSTFKIEGADFIDSDGNSIMIATDPNSADIKIKTSSDSPYPNKIIGTIGFIEDGQDTQLHTYN